MSGLLCQGTPVGSKATQPVPPSVESSQEVGGRMMPNSELIVYADAPDGIIKALGGPD